jgi:hypothetical protein
MQGTNPTISNWYKMNTSNAKNILQMVILRLWVHGNRVQGLHNEYPIFTKIGHACFPEYEHNFNVHSNDDNVLVDRSIVRYMAFGQSDICTE